MVVSHTLTQPRRSHRHPTWRADTPTPELWTLDSKLPNPQTFTSESRTPAPTQGGSTRLGRLRLALASLAQAQAHPAGSPAHAHATLTLPSAPHFLWVTEFPLFTHADADKDFLAHGRWSSSHHPFTAPMWEDVGRLFSGEKEQVGKVRGQHYDLVLNGTEIGGGSVRVHDPVMQEYIFDEILQLDPAEKARFSHLLHALRCGAPPHGGIALGASICLPIREVQASL
ncbi:hypothetical protein EIP86_011246 [Pleurotus ostreatoroseus]|nr:hypothetical protein EIP86_011246 [Pleurotus ostreatoroseus]